jgi:arginyl-tRNA synthetase
MIVDLQALFRVALAKIEGTVPEKLQILPVTHERFGDFQTNVALQHAGVLRKNPLAIAKELISHLPKDSILEEIEIAPPGFINITLKNTFVCDSLEALFDDPFHGVSQFGTDQVHLVDYSSPNVAKTMHVAHLRSTIIGDAIKKIHKACGFTVIADNHVGDWGTQFGKLLYAFKNFSKDLEAVAILDLERLYQEFNARAEQEPELEDLARQELCLLQEKQEPNYSLWKQFTQTSLEEFRKIYERLGVEFDFELGESFYHDFLEETVESLKSCGLCRESEGAQVVFFPQDDPSPFLIQKKDGSFLYATTDLAAIRYREKKFNPSSVIYVTDSRQKLHFTQLFKVAELMGCEIELLHLPFGLMKFSGGSVMSTRKGGVISLDSLLNEAESRALEVVRDQDYSESEKSMIARIVGIGAIKYQDLSQNPATDIQFSWEKALNLEGNSAPYLQYAYARVCGIHRKFKSRYPEEDPLRSEFRLTLAAERKLAFALLGFGSIVEMAARSLRPHLVASALYELASSFAGFYSQCPILPESDSSLRQSRMRLSLLCARQLHFGLSLLGIETLDRM